MNTARRLAIPLLLVALGPAPAGAQLAVSGGVTAPIGNRDGGRARPRGGEVEADVTIR